MYELWNRLPKTIDEMEEPFQVLPVFVFRFRMQKAKTA